MPPLSPRECEAPISERICGDKIARRTNLIHGSNHRVRNRPAVPKAADGTRADLHFHATLRRIHDCADTRADQRIERAQLCVATNGPAVQGSRSSEQAVCSRSSVAVCVWLEAHM